MNDWAISHYLDVLHMDSGYQAVALDCELCGSEHHEVLLPRICGPEPHGVDLPVLGCQACGHIFQKYRFDAQFYKDYYDKFYRLKLFGNSAPEKAFFLDQVRRGEYLHQSLREYLPERGRLLDVGCSAGGLMIPFAKRGWSVTGNDPDRAYVEYGKQIGLNIELTAAEEMDAAGDVDLIIINGSLEHMYDVHCVMQRCRQASSENGMLLIEGRALGHGLEQGMLTHNHRRYLSGTSIELLMRMHGWEPLLITEQPLCGPTRPGAVFVLGRCAAPSDDVQLERVKAQGRERLESYYRGRFRALVLPS
ncbi:class I SAM-dependent methyltransferase [Pseudomonas syringae pv. actinidifoliorum]|nr:class I SAM-dependent methyltransferase [Pseudomonas syringae pv. actinidifoliorum]MDU8523946.1 class I SAM-dependent methyltransferase [Pseudomonas syringae pv. actinidifoliorum]MDU8525825.1 class I SAM-dependent methyltransferase [Pseudomonas syringae pv. actinidifoliorum]